jgi:hypothetical protein
MYWEAEIEGVREINRQPGLFAPVGGWGRL